MSDKLPARELTEISLGANLKNWVSDIYFDYI